MLLSLLSSKGDIQIVRENNSLIVEDGAYQVFQIEKAISSLEKSNSIPQTKTFSLEYVQAGEIVSSLGALLSPQGSIEIVGNSLVVKDNNWVIEQIRKRIEELDISGNSS
jgi:type II secretory pathway component GspD/PulD (secretin)